MEEQMNVIKNLLKDHTDDIDRFQIQVGGDEQIHSMLQFG